MNAKAKARTPKTRSRVAVAEPTFTLTQVRNMMALKGAIIADDFADYQRAREQYLRHFPRG